MKIEAVITMTTVLGLVWGGFIVLLAQALKHEKRKRLNGEK